MNTVNPYAPPEARVADVNHEGREVQPVPLWSARGRIGRLRYLASMTAAYLLVTFASLVVGIVAGIAHAPTLLGVVSAASGLAMLVFAILKTIQRSHDMNWDGWTCLIAFIPLVNFVWVFKAGTPGPNRYGAPPPPNTLGVKLLGLMFPIIMGIGIVAAIALPAYVQYKNRAAQTQAR